jgi:IS30 family transposase
MKGLFTQLLYHERTKIYNGLCEGRTKKEIAFMLGRAESTISREIRRNSDQYGYLYAGDAHKKAKQRHNKNIPKIIKNKHLQEYIIIKLKDRWSPSTIADSWNSFNKMTISKEAIYQWIYSSESQALELKKLLVRSRKKRGLRRKPSIPNIKNRVSIHDRPDAINQRIEPNHYECDLMFNAGSQSKNICTFIERVSRKSFFIRNNNKSSSTVINNLIQCIIKNKLDVKSITFDNGSEFANHYWLNDMKIDTYFCDAGAPSQKGSIENLNGIARRYLPFELAADDITDEYVKHVEKLLDLMPRKILANKTPLEAFNDCISKSKRKESRMKTDLPSAEAICFNQNIFGIAFHP